MAEEIYKSVVTVDMEGQMASIVNHWKCSAPASTNDFENALSLVTALQDGIPPIGFINRLVNLLPDSVFISSIVAQRVAATGGNTAHQVYQASAKPGGVASPYHTGQLAACVIWLPSVYPAPLGRNFIPAVPESMIEGGRFSAAFQSAVDLFIATVIAGVSGGGNLFMPCIYNRTTKVGADITEGYLSIKPGTQRRREKPL